MAIGDYYIDIPSFPEIRPNQEVKFDNVWLKLQTEEYPDAFINVENGHRSVIVSAPAITTVANGPGTISQKRNAVIALVEADIRNWGVAESDQALRDFQSLLPSETWPEDGYTVKIDLT